MAFRLAKLALRGKAEEEEGQGREEAQAGQRRTCPNRYDRYAVVKNKPLQCGTNVRCTTEPWCKRFRLGGCSFLLGGFRLVGLSPGAMRRGR